ncbi:MAG: GGDEF domain-containing protein [Gammaproteobacteria bacterium]|nr:GGDEF domain-containing protein [Gammaproteobacteria bacterium]
MIGDRRQAEVAGPSPRRRESDRLGADRRLRLRRQVDRLRLPTWEEQRTQFITRFLFGTLGLAYFNVGEVVARSSHYWVAINIVHLVYLGLTGLYMLHARWRVVSPRRLRLAMWTDILGVSAVALADVHVMSPAYLVYLVIVLGNGMRYGLRAFAEAALSSVAVAALVLGLRFGDYLDDLSVASVFFIMFVGIIVAYSYSLMANIERTRLGLEAASRNDALTGLLNRRGLKEHADGLFVALTRNRSSLAVLFADLDGFKAINDIHGHDAGDRALKEVAQAIMVSVRTTDIVARFGGDEFLVIMPDTDLEQATAVAKRIQAIVPPVIDGQAQLSLTIGMGLAPLHGADLDTVLKSVDSAMYQGKLVAGRGAICRVDGGAVA